MINQRGFSFVIFCCPRQYYQLDNRKSLRNKKKNEFVLSRYGTRNDIQALLFS